MGAPGAIFVGGDDEGELADEPAEWLEEIGEIGAGPVSGASPIDPRRLGTLVHDVIARIDFADAKSIAGIRMWCEHLAPQHVDPRAGEAAALAHEMIERLVKSPRGRELAKAAAVHRELEFLLAWTAGSREQGAGSRENSLLVRGFIDCLYRDAGGGWHLVDYKTNDVTAAKCVQEAKQYEMQLYVYAMAAERSLGVAPVELAIHFLRPGVELTFAWDESARQRGIDMISGAIGKLTGGAGVASDAAQWDF
jgi:ATP-dependent exoDNAse (exonuclease V) beta subunit